MEVARESNGVLEKHVSDDGNADSNKPDSCNNSEETETPTEDVKGASGETYKTDEASSDLSEEKSTKNCVLKMLDEMDRRVDKLRSDALKVEAERDDVLASLDTLLNSQLVYDLDGIDLDEVNRYIKRLARRSAAVKVEISTERSIPQQESLQVVNTLIDAMIREMKLDVALAKRRCMSYLNSCSDESDATYHQGCGIDAAFEQAVLGCTIEDQKRVKKRLNGLYSYFATFSPSLSEIKEETEN